jgi:hypothetical protein
MDQFWQLDDGAGRLSWLRKEAQESPALLEKAAFKSFSFCVRRCNVSPGSRKFLALFKK